MVRLQTKSALVVLGCFCFVLIRTTALAQSTDEEQRNFFEKSVRPILVARCLECHSKETESNGGLLLDSKSGWSIGGDSGPAINHSEWQSSLLWIAVEYRNPKLQMPPDAKLSDQEREILQRWISNGAFDPRDASEVLTPKKSTALSVEEAQKHWAYRSPIAVPVPSLELSSGNSIDVFLKHGQSATRIQPSVLATESTLRQRVYVDLHGMRPRVDPLSLNKASNFTELQYADLVDELLASPRFGERFARYWMDAVRFAESITLRGFVLPDAWRYRNYLIQSFNNDKPIAHFIREQIAGDLMPSETLEARQNQLIATTALALGDTNLEEQDKKQLEMDYIDEQLELIGKVFLGQTIGCARCHDHKFDPIPTRDYYALAGIMKSSIALEHSNVSKWISVPLPLDAVTEARYVAMSSKRNQVKKQLDDLKKVVQSSATSSSSPIRIEDLQGIVVDDSQAKKIGEWSESTTLKPFVGVSYLHDKNEGKGAKSLTFEPAELKPGSYRIRLSYNHDANRSKATAVRIFSADGEDLVRVNQTERPADDGFWLTLGTYRFESGGQAFVIISNEESNGHVVADAVQFLPEGVQPIVAKRHADQGSKSIASKEAGESLEGLRNQAVSLEAELKALQSELDIRPTVMSLRASETPSNIAIHVRGNVHQQGATVPRGFLSCIPNSAGSEPIDAASNGRLELANWLVSDANPLTARVYVNRVWYWLMGEGIVRTIDNFGTTGETPCNPELLDWLTLQFIQHEWSTKWLVREIVNSDAYKRASQCSQSSMELDPDNRMFARGYIRRLDAETFRDTLLDISGELELVSQIESTIQPRVKEDYAFKHTSNYRSVYGPWFRNSLPALYAELDGANPSFPISKRNRSTIAPQAMSILNSEWIAARTSRFGSKLALEPNKTDEQRISHCFLSILSRLPSSREMQWARGAVTQARQDQIQEDKLWGSLAHELVASIDFRYVE